MCVATAALVPGKFFFEFLDESSHRCALWGYKPKSKILGQYLHPLSRYGNFNFFGFLTVWLYFPANCFQILTANRQTQNRWNFCNISTSLWVICEWRIFIFNSVLTVYGLFSTFLHFKICQKSSNEDRTFLFFPLTAEALGFLYTLIWRRWC